MKQRLLQRLSLGLAAVLCVVAVGSASAATSSKSSSTKSSGGSGSSAGASKTDSSQPSAAGGTVQGYGSDTVLQPGTMVMLADKTASKVKPATSKQASDMFGVTVDPHLLSLTLSNPNLPNEVYVATTGTYQLYVSTQNGAIKEGDYVTISAVDGVAMKATTDQKMIFGRAAGGFDGKSNTIGTVTLKDTAGKQAKTASLGAIPVVIDIRSNPQEKSTKANLPSLLQRLGQAIADKPISPVKIFFSIAIAVISVIAAIVILYSGIRNSIISIGRNPLSKKSIFRGLLEVILSGIIVLIIGLFAVYLLLKL